MIAHLQAVKALLEPLGYDVHLIYAYDPSAQYVVLEAPGWGRPEEMPASGTSATLDTDFRVKVVGPTTDSALIMLGAVRGLLSPSLGVTAIPLTGRNARVWFVRSEFVSVDRDATSPLTDQHPALGVDTYHLLSEPA